jgi:hypothetical protein
MTRLKKPVLHIDTNDTCLIQKLGEITGNDKIKTADKKDM